VRLFSFAWKLPAVCHVNIPSSVSEIQLAYQPNSATSPFCRHQHLAMEALAGAASVIAVVQLADRVLSLCGKYALAVKDAKEDIQRLKSEVEALRDVLTGVDKLVGNNAPNSKASESALVALAGSIPKCKVELDELMIRLDPSKGRKVMNRFGLRALKWPFKSKDVTKIIEALDRHKGTITLSLNVDQR
jgi:hypothetical protein